MSLALNVAMGTVDEGSSHQDQSKEAHEELLIYFSSGLRLGPRDSLRPHILNILSLPVRRGGWGRATSLIMLNVSPYSSSFIQYYNIDEIRALALPGSCLQDNINIRSTSPQQVPQLRSTIEHRRGFLESPQQRDFIARGNINWVWNQVSALLAGKTAQAQSH